MELVMFYAESHYNELEYCSELCMVLEKLSLMGLYEGQGRCGKDISIAYMRPRLWDILFDNLEYREHEEAEMIQDPPAYI